MENYVQNPLLVPTKIVRCKRRTLAIVINNKNELIVRAPIKMSEKCIFDFINQKANWIVNKRSKPIIEKFECKDNAKIEILFNEYTINLCNLKTVKKNFNTLLVPNENSLICLIKYIKKQMKKYLLDRVETLAKLNDFHYQSISISSAKTNWGSCSFNNKLHFTFRLAFVPCEVLDYIIIHELCHTIIKNHSAKFWQLVANCCPEYKTCEKWLKSHKQIMEFI